MSLRDGLTFLSRSHFGWAAGALGMVLLWAYWAGQITVTPITSDAAQTLELALNLEREGTISADDTPPGQPSMYREPVPIAVTALAVKVVDAFLGRAEKAEYYAGDRARLLKHQNIVWMTLLCAAIFWACYLLTSSITMGAVSVLLVNLRIPLVASGLEGLEVDTLYTESGAAALLMAASVFLILAVRTDRLLHAVVAGVLLGLLALVKAITLYVTIGLVGALVLERVIPDRLVPRMLNFRQILVLMIGFATIVAPWLYRNYQAFGSAQIAERGGMVLYIRAVKNEMTADEYLGSFFVWAPAGVRPSVGRLFGVSDDDIGEGRRWQRLNRRGDSAFAERDRAAERAGKPEEAISYYRAARAERARLSLALEAQGVKNAMVEADRTLQERAIAMIMERPLKHLAMTLPFLWRGALTLLPFLFGGFALALYRRSGEFLVFVLPAVGLVLFYALFSHFIPRYSAPVVPVAIAAGVVLLSAAVGPLKTRLTAWLHPT